MALPFFYKEDIELTTPAIVLDEATSKHIVQVLRMQNGEQLLLTDGKGNLFTGKITDNNRKKCTVAITHKSTIANHKSTIVIGISLLKNTTRFEWFLEKATELGVAEIIPLICERTEKTKFKIERMQSILISAMLQSQQCRLPILHQPTNLDKLLQSFQALPKLAKQQQKFIAHCEDENEKVQLSSTLLNGLTPKLILIGPEGDFTKQEIELALQNNFIPVTLGNTRLRTETAGVVAATLLSIA